MRHHVATEPCGFPGMFSYLVHGRERDRILSEATSEHVHHPVNQDLLVLGGSSASC